MEWVLTVGSQKVEIEYDAEFKIIDLGIDHTWTALDSNQARAIGRALTLFADVAEGKFKKEQ